MTIRATVSPTQPTFSKKSARTMLMEAGKEMEEWRLDELWKVASATIRNDSDGHSDSEENSHERNRASGPWL